MSENSLLPHDIPNLAGIYVGTSQADPAGISPISDGGVEKYVCCGRRYESVTYTDSRKNQLVFPFYL